METQTVNERHKVHKRPQIYN